VDRRSAIVFGMAALLGACGGGGGTAGPGTTAITPGDTPSSAPQSSNIAMWGDSLTPSVALNLQLLVPGRTVFDGGFLGQTSTFIAAQQAADMSMTTWINVFWEGHNNITAPETIKADIAASVAHLAAGNRRFMVVSLLNNAWTAMKGTEAYARVLKLNADLQAQYPDNYLEVRNWLVAHYDPNQPQDVADFANDVPPSSLRYDDIHLRNEGSVLVAQRIKQFLDARGW
jgi:hypothetical protein